MPCAAPSPSPVVPPSPAYPEASPSPAYPEASPSPAYDDAHYSDLKDWFNWNPRYDYLYQYLAANHPGECLPESWKVLLVSGWEPQGEL